MNVGPWILVVVDGPSEARDQDGDKFGAVAKLLAYTFGPECAAGATVSYWRQVSSSPLRGTKLSGYVAKAKHLARLGRMTAYGTVMLVDNDHKIEQDRLAELEQGAIESGCRERTAIGVARQMLESWLLADQSLPEQSLPSGKTCEELWGEKKDPNSNYPKHVLRRCILEPHRWRLADAIDRWNPERARQHAPSLHAFMTELEALASSQHVH